MSTVKKCLECVDIFMYTFTEEQKQMLSFIVNDDMIYSGRQEKNN